MQFHWKIERLHAVVQIELSCSHSGYFCISFLIKKEYLIFFFSSISSLLVCVHTSFYVETFLIDCLQLQFTIYIYIYI
jgi:hypothetical protein